MFIQWQKKDCTLAAISQHRDDNMLSLCISEVQLSPKWHTDNNIHSCCIETKEEAFLIIDKQHIFTFPHLKVISPWSSTQCLQCEDVPIKKQQAYLFIQERLGKKTPAPVLQLREKPLTNLTFLPLFFHTHTFNFFDWSFCASYLLFNYCRRGRNTHRGSGFKPTCTFHYPCFSSFKKAWLSKAMIHENSYPEALGCRTSYCKICRQPIYILYPNLTTRETL